MTTDLAKLLPLSADPERWPPRVDLHHQDVREWAEQHVPSMSANCFADWVCEAWDDIAAGEGDDVPTTAVVLASMLRQWCGEGHDPVPDAAQLPDPKTRT